MFIVHYLIHYHVLNVNGISDIIQSSPYLMIDFGKWKNITVFRAKQHKY